MPSRAEHIEPPSRQPYVGRREQLLAGRCRGGLDVDPDRIERIEVVVTISTVQDPLSQFVSQCLSHGERRLSLYAAQGLGVEVNALCIHSDGEARLKTVMRSQWQQPFSNEFKQC